MMVCLCGGSVFQRSQTAGDLRSLPVECRQTALQGRNLPDDVVGTDHGTALPVVGFSSNILPAASSVSKMLSLRESVYTLRVKRIGMVRTEHGNCSCMEVFLTKISIESMQPMPPNRPSPATGPNPGTVVTKAALRAASQPEMTNRAFANVVGLSEATISPAARPSSTGGATPLSACRRTRSSESRMGSASTRPAHPAARRQGGRCLGEAAQERRFVSRAR